MSEYQVPAADSGRITGALILAAALTIVVGAFQIIAGLAVVGDKDFLEEPANYWYRFNSEFWGWVHLILGIVVVVAGIALFARRAWAAYTVLALAGLSAMWNFLILIWYPWWAILVIAIDILVIWAVTRPDVGLLDEWA
jgi:hypothetical protein